MYNQEETKWFSQALFFHKDKTEGSDASLRISISTGTQDFANFNIPKLAFQIQNHLHKSINLDLHNARDLLIGLRENLKRDDPLDGEPTIRKISYNHEISISFHSPSNPKTKIVIRSSETDFAGVIISLQQFKTVLKIMESFVNNYITIADGLVLRSISYQLGKLEDLRRDIRGLYSQKPSIDCIPDSGAGEQSAGIDSEAVAVTHDLSDQLDSFLGQDMGNIKVPEISENLVEEQKEKTVTEINSKLFDLLQNDIGKMITIIENETALDSFSAQLSTMLDIETLPGIKVGELRMMTYFTKLYIDLTTSSAVQFNTPIPPGFPVIKYKPANVNSDHIDLAYDLFLTGAYIKLFRRKLENHQSDIFVNQSVNHLKFRMFTDPMVFGVLTGKSEEKVLSSIVSRYEYYKKKGFFNSIDAQLKAQNIAEITKKEIMEYVNEVSKRAFSHAWFTEFFEKAKEMHKLRLSADNNLNLEQIKNELIPLEIKEKLTKKIEPEDLMDLTPEVSALMQTKKPKKTSSQLNAIQMFVKKYKIEVPEDSFDKLMEYLKDFGDKKIDFQTFPFQVEDFEEAVLKGLFYWDPEKYKNATSLQKDLDDSMTKDLILAKLTSNDEEFDTAGFANALDSIEID